MPQLILFDTIALRKRLLPFTFTRPVADIRIGITTIREKWETRFKCASGTITEKYLGEKFPAQFSDDNILVNGGCLPDDALMQAVESLQQGEALYWKDIPLAFRCTQFDVPDTDHLPEISEQKKKYQDHEPFLLKNVWDIFQHNERAFIQDFESITAGKTSAPVDASNTIIGNGKIFIEAGAKVFGSVFNTSTGAIYIGKDAEVMEGCMVRGPMALCEHATLKMGTKIYGATTIGPYSKVGGEVNNSVIFGYSNKAHDGFLGNSVLGEWCNLGADSNNSNLKNNYSEVKLWNYSKEKFLATGLQFCGLFMGDHSKCGINTMFNTGTVVGVSANIFGSGYPRNFIPSFSWGGAQGMSAFRIEQAFELAEVVMQRRNKIFTEADRDIFKHIYELEEKFNK